MGTRKGGGGGCTCCSIKCSLILHRAHNTFRTLGNSAPQVESYLIASALGFLTLWSHKGRCKFEEVRRHALAGAKKLWVEGNLAYVCPHLSFQSPQNSRDLTKFVAAHYSFHPILTNKSKTVYKKDCPGQTFFASSSACNAAIFCSYFS